MCTPAGAEEFFAAVGTKLASKHDVPAKVAELAPKYRTEILKHDLGDGFLRAPADPDS